MCCWCRPAGLFLPQRAGPGKNPAALDTNTVMVLSTTPSSTAASARVNVREADICALACAASAGARLAFAFAVATVALAIAALGLALAPGPVVSLGVAALLLGTAGAYLMSRTGGLPGLTQHPESFDALGVGISLLEVAAAVVVVRRPHPRRN